MDCAVVVALSKTISCPSEEAQCHLFSDQYRWRFGVPFLYLCRYNSLNNQSCIVSRIVRWQLVSYLPHPHHLTWVRAHFYFPHTGRGGGETGQWRPGGGQIVTGCSESGASAGDQGTPPYYGTRPRPGGLHDCMTA